MEKSLLMVKPDGVSRGLIGEIISRVEKKGFKIAAMKMTRINKELAKRHYREHNGKPFFEGLVEYITSGPVVMMVVEGRDTVRVLRSMIGTTDPKDAPLGTIRGDFGLDVGRNIVHASDSKDSAAREISLFFNPDEILDYEKADNKWVYES